MRGSPALVVVAALLFAAGSALGEGFTVTNNDDAGRGSLRAAISAANREPGRDVISFAPRVGETIDLDKALPELRGELEVRGPGADALAVRRSSAPGTPNFRVLTVPDGSNVTISGLTISNGRGFRGGGVQNLGVLKVRGAAFTANRAGFSGGGIHSGEEGRLLVVDSAFSGNATGSLGGGISSEGPLRLIGSTFSENSSENEAAGVRTGGVYRRGGKATIERSTFANNTAEGAGGGVTNNGDLTVIGSTFSGNTARHSGGGAIYNFRDLTVVHSTFARNAARIGGGVASVSELTITSSTVAENTAGTGGGIYNSYGGDGPPGVVAIKNTIVADNEAQEAPDARGDFSSGGHNLIGDMSGSMGFGLTDLQNLPPGLDPEGPKDNGGPTQTVALLPDSPAVDAVGAGCPPPETDQRGVSRPQDGDGDGTALCDVGAYERDAAR